jgi:hypothetical protein
MTALLRHAFLSGRGLKDDDKLSDADLDAWCAYDPTMLPVYQLWEASVLEPASPPAEALPSQTSGVEAVGYIDESDLRVLTRIKGQTGACRITAIKAHAWPGYVPVYLAKPASEPAGGGVLIEAAQALEDGIMLASLQRDADDGNDEEEAAAIQAIEDLQGRMKAASVRLRALSSPASSSPAEATQFLATEDGEFNGNLPEAEALQAGVDFTGDLRRRAEAAETECRTDDADAMTAAADIIDSHYLMIASLQGQLSAALSALRPFADAIEGNDDPKTSDGADIWEAHLAMNITFGDLRRARALSSAPAQEDGSKELSAHPRDSGQSTGGVEGRE